MKKVAFGILVLGLTSLGFSQQAAEPFLTASLEDFASAPANAFYLESVADDKTPRVVQTLQQKAAAFDVTANAEFDSNSDQPFEVVFKSNKGSLIAQYNSAGEIISARENFKDVALPKAIRGKAAELGTDWKMHHNRFQSNYVEGKVLKKVYRINMRNGDQRKTLTIHIK